MGSGNSVSVVLFEEERWGRETEEDEGSGRKGNQEEEVKNEMP